MAERRKIPDVVRVELTRDQYLLIVNAVSRRGGVHPFDQSRELAAAACIALLQPMIRLTCSADDIRDSNYSRCECVQ